MQVDKFYIIIDLALRLLLHFFIATIQIGFIVTHLRLGSLAPRPVREISMEPIIVGVSMEMPLFTMTSFHSARGQVE